MVKFVAYINSLVFIFLFVACEKVIDVDLKEADKKYVIEGIITNDGAPVKVRISQTSDFDEDNNFNKISNASVVIKDNNGDSVSLAEVQPGLYETSSIAVVSGRTYQMTVDISGKIFTASSTMPFPVNLDSIYTIESGFGQDRKMVVPKYSDPIGLGNSYRFVLYVNGLKQPEIFVQNDELTDGRTITRPLRDFGIELRSGDLVTVEMQCIDASMYTYWFTFLNATGQNETATPANPVTNINGGALGYFSAHTVQAKSMMVK